VAENKPRSPIRRFDVFAEYQRVQLEDRGMPENRAKGRGIWAAKVVAGRGGRGGPAPKPRSGTEEGERGAKAREDEEDEFRSAGGVPQTDATFDHEIIDRMGRDFYQDVFHPAIAQAYREGKRYEDIRDVIRKEWK
jgi:hypothetical protein